MFQHDVSVIVDGHEIFGWGSYSIDSDMLGDADQFEMSIAATREVWRLCVEDAPVRIAIDGVVVMSGFIDSREVTSDTGASTLHIVGRDRAGRLAQESIPRERKLGGLTLHDLAEELAAPWLPEVVFSNARNRDLVRGRGNKARVGREPPVFDSGQAPSSVAAGTMRWEALREFVTAAGYLAWSTADGEQLVIGRPNYEQAHQFFFYEFLPEDGDDPASNCLSFRIKRSVADRYSKIVVTGLGRGDKDNYGANVTGRVGVARDNPDDPDGVGKSFRHPKRWLVTADVSSVAEAQRQAERLMAERDASGFELELTVPGHGQIVGIAREPTIFTFDTVCFVRHELTDIHDTFLITRCTYRGDSEGETTELSCVPLGTELTL